MWMKKGRSRFRPLLLSVVLVLFFDSACGNLVSRRRQQGEGEARVSGRPGRIVSLSPSVTEILYGVGAWPQVVAVSEYCDYPDDVATRARVDGWRNLNLEQVTALKPDLVIGVDDQSPFIRDKLAALGINSLFLDSRSLKDVLAAIKEVGRVTGHEREGFELAARTRGEIEATRAAVADRPRPRVLCIVNRVPGTLRDLYTATHGSYLDELVSMAGGQSIAPPDENGYGKMTKEAVVTLDPEVIIDMVQSSKGDFGEDPTAVWRELSEISAVRTGRVYPVRETRSIHPSQFVSQTARAFAELIHPEAFK